MRSVESRYAGRLCTYIGYSDELAHLVYAGSDFFLMYAVAAVKGALYRIAEPLLIATVMYFCLTFPTSKIIAYFERRMSRGDRR